MTSLNPLQNIIKTIHNAVFPRFCVRCQQEGSLLCADCAVSWQPPPMSLSTLDSGHVASLNYADPVARALICAWKYKFDASAWEHLKRTLSGRLQTLRQIARTRRIEALVPLPLHSRRLCERGFDQAEEIVLFLGQELELPVQNLLIRTRATGKQADREEAERIEYMKDNPFKLAIDCCYPIASHSVLLVDDVWTTGATALAGVQILKNVGVENVLVYTLAKGK